MSALVFVFLIYFGDGTFDMKLYPERWQCEVGRDVFIATLQAKSKSDFFNPRPSEAAVSLCASMKLTLIRRPV